MSSTTATSLMFTPSSSASTLAGSNAAVKYRQQTPSEALATTANSLLGKAHALAPSPSKSTPKTTLGPATPASTPGKFRHPRTTEILARNSASAISERGVKGAVTNVAALVLSFAFSDLYYNSATPLLGASGLANAAQISSIVLLCARLLFCLNVFLFLRPVIPYASAHDDIRDIPLTPSQRALLGLKPSSLPAPSSAVSAASYITPPRYRRFSGSISGSPAGSQVGNDSNFNDRRSISANYYSSPVSTSRYTVGFSPTPSHSLRRTASGSPFSPSPSASPLFHKATHPPSQLPEVDFGASTGSGLGRSQSFRERPVRESFEPASPTPGTRSPQVVPGRNYKWLYDTGRKLPKTDLYSGF